MNRKLIARLARDPDRKPETLWRYHISGNTVELLTTAPHGKEPELYREGVIEIGRLLQALEQDPDSRKARLHIQSFPDLNDPRLIATVRTRHPYPAIANSPVSSNGAGDFNELETAARTLGTQYGFPIHPISALGEKPSEALLARPGNPADIPDDRPLYLLGSTIDNPFVWLKTGRWAERIMGLSFPGRAGQKIWLDVRITEAERLKFGSELQTSRFVQLIFG